MKSDIFQVYEGQHGSYILQEYKKLIEKDKYDTSGFVSLMKKLEEVLDVCNTIGKNSCKYYFRSYCPGFVAADPFFFYFNTIEELKDYLFKKNPFHKPDEIYVEKRDRKESFVMHKTDDEKPWVIGFIRPPMKPWVMPEIEGA